VEAPGTDAPIAAQTSRRPRVRARLGVVLLLLGLVVAFVPGLAAGDRFLSVRWHFVVLDSPSERADAADLRRTRIAPAGVYSSGGPAGTAGEIEWPGSSLTNFVSNDTRWALAAATLLTVPLLFAWWRRSAAGFIRNAGFACSLAAAVAACAMALTHPAPPRNVFFEVATSRSGLWWTVPFGAALMAAAFAVAPTPARPLDD
jgi:hypothetical protein